jgi:hypothetical protein
MGVTVWIVSGVMSAAAIELHWDAVAIGCGQLFSLLFLTGLVAAGVKKSQPE